jgi:hypothetical protein
MRKQFADKNEWDEPPQLLFLYNVEGKVSSGRSVIPPDVWSLGRPPDILLAMSESLDAEGDHVTMLDKLRPDSLCGVAFYCEGWTLDLEGRSSDEVNEALEQSQEHTIYTREDKVEMTFIGAHTADGPVYAQMIRGRDPDFLLEENAKMEGAVPESLERLYELLVAGERKSSE